MQDPKETFNNIEQNTEMALLQSEKIAESVDNLEPIMEGVLVKTDEMVQEMKKNNDKPVNETKIIFEGVEMTEIRGRDGKDGEKGDKGDTGIQGSKGEKGDKGDHGEKGDKGEDGTNGYDGRDGLDGYDGKDGQDGIDGRDGVDGKDGKDGTEIKAEEIKQKLESLEVGLDYEKLSNVPDIAKIARMASSKTVSLKELDDVDLSGVIQNNGKYVLGGGTGLTAVEHDSTLTGAGTTESPLSVVATSASDVAITVRAATTAALAGSPVYDNGTAGVGATLTRGTNGVLPNQDGRTLIVGDRLLVKNQSTTLQNGVYEVTSIGSASSKWVLTRTTDADETSELDELVVTISEGSTNRGTVWGQQTNNPVVGTSAIVFATVVSTAVTQATSGTQVINQIPLYTGTARQLTRGTANFKYNPTTDLFTIRGIDYTFPANNGDASQVLTTDGSGNLSWETGGGGTPGGSNRSIQFNTSGAFDGGNDLTWDSERKRFYAGDITETQNHTYQTLDDSGSLYYVNGLRNIIPASITTSSFAGSGLDDLTTSGTFTGLTNITYTVTVSATGTPDLFDWTDTNGGSGTNVPMSTSPTLLSNDVSVVFGADTGHTLTDSWTFDGIAAVTTYGKMLNLDGAAGTMVMGDVDTIGNSTKITINDVTQLVTISNVPAFNSEADAITAGLTAGQIWQTTSSDPIIGAAGFLRIIP